MRSPDSHVVQFSNSNKEGKVEVVSQEKATLSFYDIHYEVLKKRDDIPCCGKTEMKEILCGVSGLLPPGLNAIMGPTGSGKTSLLDILSKRKDPKGLTAGHVLLNGRSLPKNFRLMSGYVVQDDVVMGTLSVRENLAFSANLRLPNNVYDKQARRDKVEEVIVQLGLQSCADTRVGNEFVRGVSGGERKRVNIGMEMILDPPVLFLDEPTTGLDANTANSTILLLNKLARDGRNIIVSIHQPRYSIFTLFDRLIILNKGSMVYRGKASDTVDYFSNIGFTCPTHHNPADFFLDIVGGDVNTAQLLDRMEHSNPSANLESGLVDQSDSNKMPVDVTENKRSDHIQYLLESFAQSSSVIEETKQLQAILNENNHGKGDVIRIDKAPDEITYANGFSTQLNAVFRRTVLNIIRNPAVSLIQVFIMVLFGILSGMIFYQTGTTITGVQDRAGCFFFLTTIHIMSNLSALQLFIQERPHFIHESASGYYRASVYFISQVFADLIPKRIFPTMVLGLIAYFMIGLKPNAGSFFIFVLSLSLTSMCACSIAFLVSASVRLFAVANVMVALPFLLMMLFGGFLVNTGSLLTWLEWIKHLSIFRYGINALTVNEMTGLIFINDPNYPGFNRSSPTPCLTANRTVVPDCLTGEQYMDQQGIAYGSWGQWQNIVALASMSVGFLFFAYIQLRRVDKFK